MSRKFKVWLDSGANNQSKYETKTDLDNLGISSEAWDKMSEKEKDEAMREIAFEASDWGYSEEKDEEKDFEAIPNLTEGVKSLMQNIIDTVKEI
jgi:hypothetical protein